jgi:hypothetical protein
MYVGLHRLLLSLAPSNGESFSRIGVQLCLRRERYKLISLFRLLFAATTVLAAIHVVRTRYTSETKPAPEMQVNSTV